MTRQRNKYWRTLCISITVGFMTLLTGCEFIKMKREETAEGVKRYPVARVNNAYLYKDELTGIVSAGTAKEDSTVRIEAYINSWIRKQLLIQEAARKIDINEAEVERK